MKELDASRGLGDALYLRAVVLHLIDLGEDVTVFTKWPDIFSDLNIVVKSLSQYTGMEDIRHAKYCLHCRIPDIGLMDIFTMICRQAGIESTVKLEMRWQVKNPDLIGKIKRRAAGRKIFVYQPPKLANGPAQELMRPSREDFIDVLEKHTEYYRIKVGHPSGAQEYKEAPCDLDLFGKTSIHGVLDVCTIGDLFFSEPSFLLIAAEMLDKNFIAMFTRRAAESNVPRICTLSPNRFFHKPHLGAAIYVN